VEGAIERVQVTAVLSSTLGIVSTLVHSSEPIKAVLLLARSEQGVLRILTLYSCLLALNSGKALFSYFHNIVLLTLILEPF
jgi:hypothetical protein